MSLRWTRPWAAARDHVDTTGRVRSFVGCSTEYGARAERADCALLTAFGYDFVPGNLAGASAGAPLTPRTAGCTRRRTGVFYAH